jgi:hypothetical protein
MKESRKIEILCQLKDLLEHTLSPSLREAGLTEKETEELDQEKLVEFIIVADVGDDLDRYRIARLTRKAFGILSRAGPAAAPLLRTVPQPPHSSKWSKIRRGVG